jgi:SAM-dependent methyltransferase
MADHEDVLTFYDAMAADYHLIFQDWVQAQEQQGHLLDRLIRKYIDENRYPLIVLDCACGIGTQAIGLAKQGGYRIHASDISPQALARAESEARQAEVNVRFAVADTQFFVVPRGPEWRIRYYTTSYRALRRETLTSALSQAGFGEVSWLMPAESGFYQPICLPRPRKCLSYPQSSQGDPLMAYVFSWRVAPSYSPCFPG